MPTKCPQKHTKDAMNDMLKKEKNINHTNAHKTHTDKNKEW